MYYGTPKTMGNEDIASKRGRESRGRLSLRIPNVYVLGLAGISFPLSRLTTVVEKTERKVISPFLASRHWLCAEAEIMRAQDAAIDEASEESCPAGDAPAY
jgi:hypothetical protein